MLPAFFMGHGSPMLLVEDHLYTRFLHGLGPALKPKAIVILSAHWESEIQRVSIVSRYQTIHDFGGFPRELYQMQYPAQGAPDLAKRVGQLLEGASIPWQADDRRGLDHGAWVLLHLLYPDAEVPVVSMSVNADLSPAEQYRIGKALSALRAEDVLIIASGGTVHNFNTMRAEEDVVDDWAVQFDDWVLEKASQWDLDSLFAYETLAPNANLAVPPYGREHFIPLFYAMGAADDDRTVQQLMRIYRYGSLSHAIWQFGG